MAFSFFRFLGFGAEGCPFSGLQRRGVVRFLGFRGGVGSVFRASGEGGGPFSGLQGREGVWDLTGSWGNAPAGSWGNAPGPVPLPAL